MSDFGGFPITDGERKAIKAALDAGNAYGYGNIIAYLQKAWALRLMKSGIDIEGATKAVTIVTPYPITEDFPISFKELGFDPCKSS